MPADETAQPAPHDPPASQRRRFRRTGTTPIAAPTLGYLAAGSRSPAPVLAEPGGSASNAYKQALERLQAANTGQIFLVTEVAAGVGANAAALNLALTAVGEGLRTVLMDADGSGGGVSQYLRTADGPGLAELAIGTADLERASRLLTVAGKRRLPVIPRGVAELGDTVTSADIADAVDKISEHSDLVFVFVPADSVAAWIAALGAHADGTILAISGRESAKATGEIVKQLIVVGAPVVGVLEYPGANRRKRLAGS